MCVALLLCTRPAFCSGTLGATLSTAGGNTDIGLLGGWDTPTPLGPFHIDGTLQTGWGVSARADAHLTCTLYKSFGIRPYLAAVGKGATLDTLGGTTDAGVALNATIDKTDVGAGVFGRASATFAPTRRDRLLAAGVDGVTAEMLTDPALDAPATGGLPILKPDTPLHAIVYADWKWRTLAIGVKWLGELSFNDPIQQYRIDLRTHLPIGEKTALQVGGTLIAQAHAGQFDGESTLTGAVTRSW